ncbi:hypothetical protein G6F31_020345 [Rhizopus arrhizus]|nr:hypothetical protein G6F31_020345 [Rhizopus arrhizus]
MATETIENVAHDDTPNREIHEQLGRKYSAGFITEIESDSLPPGLDEDTILAPGRLPPLPDHADAGLGQAGDRPDRPAGAQLLLRAKGPEVRLAG